YDNVTVLLCQIESGAGQAPKKKFVEQDNCEENINKTTMSLRTKIFLGAGCIVLLVAIMCGVFYYLGLLKGEAGKLDTGDVIAQTDSINNPGVVVGEDVAELTNSNQSVVENEQIIKETKPQKPVKDNDKIDRLSPKHPDDASPDASPAPTDDQAAVYQWKTSLLARLDKCSQSALKNVVAVVRETVNSAGNDDQEKCAFLVLQVEQRVQYLNELRPYNGKLTPTGKKKFDAILAEIGNPDKFQPDYWTVAIRGLSRYLVINGESKDQNELSPIEGSDNEEQGQTDIPHELTEN
ncbi:MAG: hypothetical protein K2H60_12470, partial [Muribaculaceae bacterium]|nr:hypothetical protein [Muribaculaceae bacterium]